MSFPANSSGGRADPYVESWPDLDDVPRVAMGIR